MSAVVTTTILNTKISEVENKLSNCSGLVITAVLNTKISEVQKKKFLIMINILSLLNLKS